MIPSPIDPKTRDAIRKRRQEKKKPDAKKSKPRLPSRPITEGFRAPVKPPAKERLKPKTGPAKPPVKGKPAPEATPPETLTGPLTPERLDQEAAAAVRTRFGGTEREIQGQQRVSDQMQTNVTGWFDKYKADVESARQRTADFNTGIQAAQAQQAQQAQAVDTAAATTPEAQQAAAARRSTSDSFGSMLAAQAGSQNAYQADKGRIGSGEAVSQHLQEAGRSRTLANDLEELQGQKGDYEVGYRQDARESERKREMESAAFDLDSMKAESDAELKAAAQKALDVDRVADNKRDTSKEATRKMESDRKYRLDKDKRGADAAKDAYQRRNKLGPYKPAASGKPKGPSAADVRAEREHVTKVRDKSNTALGRIDLAAGRWDTLKDSKVTTGEKDKDGHDVLDPKTNTPKTRAITDKDIRAQLIAEKYTPNEIHLALTKKWGPQEVAMAHALGIRVPRSRLAYDPKNRANGKNDSKPTRNQQNGLGGK